MTYSTAQKKPNRERERERVQNGYRTDIEWISNGYGMVTSVPCYVSSDRYCSTIQNFAQHTSVELETACFPNFASLLPQLSCFFLFDSLSI